MNIVFWGGCVNRQQNIATERHYHAIIKQLVKTNTGVEPKTCLRFYSSYHEMHREVQSTLLREMHYDYVVVFLRPFPLIALTKPVIRYTDTKMKGRLSLHPLFSKSKYYDDMVKEYKVPVQNKNEDGLFHKVLQSLNDFAGNLLGLRQWTNDEVIRLLADMQSFATNKQAKLILVGPMLYPALPRINNVCLELNRRIALFSAINGIEHIDLARSFDDHGKPFIENDGKHLTATAHLFMAEQIAKFMNRQATTLTPVLNRQ